MASLFFTEIKSKVSNSFCFTNKNLPKKKERPSNDTEKNFSFKKMKGHATQPIPQVI